MSPRTYMLVAALRPAGKRVLAARHSKGHLQPPARSKCQPASPLIYSVIQTAKLIGENQ